MQQFLSHDTLDTIGILLVLGAIALIAFFAGKSYLDRQDEEWRRNNPAPDDERAPVQRFPVDRHNLDKIMAFHGVTPRDAEDIRRGTKL